MKRTCTDYAARVLLQEISIEDVPEERQSSVKWMVERFRPVGRVGDPVSLVKGMMRKIERLRRETK
jgi:hypothetical protein